MLEAREISFRVGGKWLLQPSDIAFEPGKFHVIMGANGAGKSTLLKLLAGDEPTATGKVKLHERSLYAYSRKELATIRAVLSQHYHISFPISVGDIVLMGRYPYFSGKPSPHDLDICRTSMDLMEVQVFKERDYQTLSGGEGQKVQMARVLAQITEEGKESEKLLFLDEPVSHLDIKFQYQLLQAAKNLCAKGTTIIAILHDLNLALSFADRFLFMKEGRIIHDLSDCRSITPQLIGEVFDTDSKIIMVDNKPVVIF